MKKNKRHLYLILFIVLIIIVVIILMLTYNKEKNVDIIADRNLTEKEALELGEDKYLRFLWMVDGAFNDYRYDGTFEVNGKKLTDKYKIMSCIYPANNQKKCVSDNFEKPFRDLFISNISFGDVYSDGLSFFWYEKIDDKYYFSNINTCNASRMSLKHTLTVEKISKNEIVYSIKFVDNVLSGDFKGNNTYSKPFILSLENEKWKISKAYYHDPCYMDYNIE